MCSESSAWAGREWKTENMLSLEAFHSFGKIRTLHWFLVCRLPSVFLLPLQDKETVSESLNLILNTTKGFLLQHTVEFSDKMKLG